MKKKRLKGSVGLLFLLALISLMGYIYVKKSSSNHNVEPFYKYISNWNENEISILWEDTPLNSRTPLIKRNSNIYIPLDFMLEYIDEFIYWEADTDTLIITNPITIFTFKIDEKEYKINNQTAMLSNAIIKIDGSPFFPSQFLEEFYNYDLNYIETTNILIIDNKDNEHMTAKIKPKKANVRFEPSLKAAIAEKTVRDSILFVYEQEDAWTMVRTSSGILGYIPTKDITDITTLSASPKEEIIIEPLYKPEKGKINLVWDQVFNENEIEKKEKRIRHPGLNVISPTWFSIVSDNGAIKSIANIEYVNWAHDNNIEVWALIDNGFDSQLTHQFLRDINTRQNIIDDLIELSKQYNLDGINIDFEEVAAEDGFNFVQFVKEAAIQLRAQGLVVSVDVNVPKPWTAHFRRDEISKYIDYLMVMSYDEHWSSSPQSGPVASLGWVIEGIDNTILEVPSEKILLGLPYYNRVWKETAEGVSSRSYSMQYAFDIMEGKNAEISWDNDSGLFYGEYSEGGAIYKCWLENEKTIEEKVRLVDEKGLAGVAGWKRGLEKDEVWDILADMLGTS